MPRPRPNEVGPAAILARQFDLKHKYMIILIYFVTLLDRVFHIR